MQAIKNTEEARIAKNTSTVAEKVSIIEIDNNLILEELIKMWSGAFFWITGRT